jgi:hypothetical protein
VSVRVGFFSIGFVEIAEPMTEPDNPTLDGGNPLLAEGYRSMQHSGRRFPDRWPNSSVMFPIDLEKDVTQSTGELTSIRQESGSTSKKGSSIASRLSRTESKGYSEAQAAESLSISYKPEQVPREVDTRCKEIIDAFGLHPLKFREGCSPRG